MEWPNRYRRTFNAYLSALDEWATSAHLAQAYLIIANCFLSLKASTNILAFLSNSTDLIIDYNGLTLFSASFNRCFFLLNLMVFVSSMFCLLALMLTLKHNSLRLLLIHCFTFSQIALVAIIMILMACLWLSPVRVNLADSFPEWRKEIANYDYRLPNSLIRWSNIGGNQLQDINEALLRSEPVASSDKFNELLRSEKRESPGRRASYVIEIQTFNKQLDLLQRSLDCCGIEGRADWATYNSEWQLKAPSCCRQPSALLLSRRRPVLANRTTNGFVAHGPTVMMVNDESSQISGSFSLREPAADQEVIYYCPTETGDDVERLWSQHGGDTIIKTIPGQGQLNEFIGARNPKAHLSPNEMLELQLAIEWTGPPRPGRFVLNQAQNLQLSIVYGCQRTMDDRLATCLLAMRLKLLILVSILTLNVIARSAALEGKSPRRARSYSRHHPHQHRPSVHQAVVISTI